MRRPALLLLLAFLSNAVSAQTVSETHGRVRTAYASRNYVDALSELRSLAARDRPVFEANNYDYLLARVAEKTGDLGEATANYQNVVNRNSVLREYSLWHLARLMRASGNLPLERIYLQELQSFSRNSVLLTPARRRMLRSWSESENFEITIWSIENRRASSKHHAAVRRDEHLLMANAYLHVNQVARAKEIFESLISAQQDDVALAAVAALDRMEGQAGRVPHLSDRDHHNRASIYQFNREFAPARSHYFAMMENHGSSELVPDAVFQIGRGYSQQGDHTEAVKWFERVQEQFPGNLIAEETLLQAASSYARLGKSSEAVVRYRKYIDRYTTGDRLDRAYLNILDVQRDQREETEALQWAARVRERFRGKLPEALATFAEARIYLSRTDWPNAIDTLARLESINDLGGTSVPGGTTLSEVRFLKGYALEQLRRYAEAIDVYVSIPDGPNEYYGWRATNRLRLMLQDEKSELAVKAKYVSARAAAQNKDANTARRHLQTALRLTDSLTERDALLAALREKYDALPAYMAPKIQPLKLGRSAPRQKPEPRVDRSPAGVGDELLFLGLFDEAPMEVEINGASRTSAEYDYTLVHLYARGDLAHRAMGFADTAWKIPSDYQIELLPSDFAAIKYPTPFADELIAIAPQRNVDARLLLSLMRQESLFRTDAKSAAAARGLMQFIAPTAARISSELGREHFRRDDLYDPSTSILFGAQYVSSLFRLFPNQTEAVAASYNGGEDNMKRWLTRAKSDLPDRYVPEIAYAQTKDYVQRVMATYRVYQLIYDENLKRR